MTNDQLGAPITEGFQGINEQEQLRLALEANAKRDAEIAAAVVNNEGGTLESLAAELDSYTGGQSLDLRDFSDKYNTKLDDQQETLYQEWAARTKSTTGKDLIADNYDYDTRGMFLSTGGADVQSGHGTDQFKKPNHPTFSNESQYDGADGYEGGYWTEAGASGKGRFNTGASNMYAPDELQRYFNDREKDVSLIDTRINNEQTALLRSVIDSGESFYGGKIKSDLEIGEEAERMGPEGMYEILKQKTDAHGGDNIIGKGVILGAGAYAGHAAGVWAGTTYGATVGATAGSAGGVVGLLIGAAVGLIVGTGAAALSVWWSGREERDIRKTLNQLNVGEYADPMDRETDEQMVADWYNDMRLEQAREDPNIFGFSAGLLLDMVPYVAEFATGTGVAKAGTKGFYNLTKAGLKGGAKEVLDSGMLRITKEQSKTILKNAAEIAKKGTMTEDVAIAMLMQKQYSIHAKAATKLMRTKLALTAPAIVAVQQPRIFSELKQQELESVTVDENGKFTFDDKALKPGSIARKEASAYLEAVTEMYGVKMLKGALKYTGVQAAMKPVVDFVMKSKMTKQFGELGTSKAVKKFFKDTEMGRSMMGRSKIMNNIYDTVGVNSSLEEFTEEYVSMTTGAILGLDKDEHPGMSYSQNVVDKLFFPATHPKEAAGMLLAFSALPGAAGAFSTLRGDATKHEMENGAAFTYKITKFLREGGTLSTKAYEEMLTEFSGRSEVKTAMGKRGPTKEGNSFLEFVGSYFRPRGKEVALNSLGQDGQSFIKLVDVTEKQVKSEGIFTGEEAKEEAVKRALSTLIVGNVATSKNELDEVLKADGIKESQQFYSLFSAGKGKVRATKAIEVDTTKRSELSASVNSYIDTADNIILNTTNTKKGENPGTRKKIKVRQSMIQEIEKAPNKKVAARLTRDLEAHVKQQIGVMRQYGFSNTKNVLDTSGKAVRGRLLPDLGQSEEGIKQITQSILEMSKRNPNAKFVFTQPIVESANTEEQAEAMSEKSGRTVSVGSGMKFQAWNSEDGTIYLTPMVAGTQGEKAAAKIVEEESLEANFKRVNNTIDLDDDAKTAIDFIVQDYKAFKAKNPETNHAGLEKLVTELNKVKNTTNRKLPLEQYVALVQAVFGSNQEANTEEQNLLIENIMSEDAKAALGNSAGILFNEQSGLEGINYRDLEAERVSAEERAAVEAAEEKKREIDFNEQERVRAVARRSSGSVAVDAFLEEKGRNTDSHQNAIEIIQDNLSGDVYERNPKSEAKAVAMLDELLKNRPKKKGIKKTKDAIREINKAYPNTTFNAEVMESEEGKVNEATVSNPSLETNFKQDHSDVIKRIPIVQALIETHGARDGKRYAHMLGRSSILKTALRKDENWDKFIEGNNGSFIEKSLRRILKEGIVNEDGSVTPLTRSDAYSLYRATSSQHVMPSIAITEDGKQVEVNRIDFYAEMHGAARNHLATREKRMDLILNYISTAIYGKRGGMNEFMADTLGIPYDLIAAASRRKDVKVAAFYKLFNLEDMKIDVDMYVEATDEWVTATSNKIINQLSSWDKTNEKYRGTVTSVMGSIPNEMRYDLSYTGVDGKRVNAYDGDSFIQKAIKNLAKDYKGDLSDTYAFAYQLDGARKSVETLGQEYEFTWEEEETASSMKGESLEKMLRSLFESSKKIHNNKRYLHNLAQFGEKGKRVMILMPVIEEKDMATEIAEASHKLSQLKPEVRAMFTDPATMPKSDVANLTYAINHLKIVETIHGDLSDYASPKKSTIENVFNVTKRASQEVTDGIAYRGKVNTIYVDDVKWNLSGKDIEAFDGMALMTPAFGKLVAKDLGKDNMYGLDQADSLKAHVSTIVNGRRVLIKVNWMNMDMVAEKNPALKKIADYVNAHNANEKDETKHIQTIAFPSGAKFRGGRELTDYENKGKANVQVLPAGSLVRSQWLNHDSEVNHEGVYMKQRAGLMLSSIIGNGLKAANLRARVSLDRANEKLTNKAYSEVLDNSDRDDVKAAMDRGESYYDPRYSKAFFSGANSLIKKSIRSVSARVALQKVGAFSNEPLDGDLTPDKETGLVRLPRAQMNIKGGRYNTYGRVVDGKVVPFISKKAAATFVMEHKTFFSDMFMPDSEGFPDYTKPLTHEITRNSSGGGWVIPGEVVEETRIPSDNYTSLGFYRLSEPYTSKAYESLNLSATPEGIRVAKGEDFDGDKGFALMFYKRKGLDSLGNESWESEFFDNENSNDLRKKNNLDGLEEWENKESSRSLMNRALNLEFASWMEEEVSRYYSATGDIPIDIFDEVIDEVKTNAKDVSYSLNTITGLANQASVIQGAGDSIGVTAVINNMYSILSGITKKIDLNDFVPNGKDKSGKMRYTRVGGITSTTHEIGIPNSIEFKNYRSTKRLIGVLLNMILDDAKNPRIFYLNINRHTAGIATVLLMTNIESNSIEPGVDIKTTDAFSDAERVMRFMASPMMKKYAEMMNDGLPQWKALKIVGEKFSSDEVSMLTGAAALQERLSPVGTIINATYKGAGQLDNFGSVRDAFNSVGTGLNGLISKHDAAKMLGPKAKNPIASLGWRVFDEANKVYDSLSEIKVLNSLDKVELANLLGKKGKNSLKNNREFYTPGLLRAARIAVLLTSVRKRILTPGELSKATAMAKRALTDYAGIPLIDALEFDNNTSSILLRKGGPDTNRELTEDEVVAFKESFNELPLGVQDALTIHALATSGTKGYFTGGYFDLISDAMSVVVNSGVKDSVNLLRNSNRGLEIVKSIFTNSPESVTAVETKENNEIEPAAEVVKPAPVTGLKLVPRKMLPASIIEKETAKFTIPPNANWYLIANGGVESSSTSDYLKQTNSKSIADQETEFKEGDYILTSVEGKREGAVPPVVDGELANGYELIPQALDAGAIVRTDTYKNANRKHNLAGEGALYKALMEGGYQRTQTASYTEWTRKEVEETFNAEAYNSIDSVKVKSDTQHYSQTVFARAGRYTNNEFELKEEINRVNDSHRSDAYNVFSATNKLDRLASLWRSNGHRWEGWFKDHMLESLDVTQDQVDQQMLYQDDQILASNLKMKEIKEAEYLLQKPWADKLRKWSSERDELDVQSLPSEMRSALKKLGRDQDVTGSGSEHHYKTMMDSLIKSLPGGLENGKNEIGYNHNITHSTEATLKKLGIEKPLYALRAKVMFLSKEEASELLLADLVDTVGNIEKTIPNLKKMPSELQMAFVLTDGQFQKDFSEETVNLINGEDYLGAANLHISDMVDSRSAKMPSGIVNERLLNMMIEYGALKDSMQSLKDGGRMSPYLKSFRRFDASIENTQAHIANKNLDALLYESGMKFPEMYTSRGLASHSAAMQMFSMKVIELKLGKDFMKQGQMNALLRIANGVPTNHQLRTGEKQLPAERTVDTYNSMVIETIDSAVYAGMNSNRVAEGSKAMHKMLLKSTRFARGFKRKSFIEFNQMLRETGGATHIDVETGKKTRATATSKGWGKRFREAISILHETPENEWGDARIIKTWADIFPTSFSATDKAMLNRYMQWYASTITTRTEERKELEEEDRLSNLEMFSEFIGENLNGKTLVNVSKLNSFLFQNKEARKEFMHTGDFEVLHEVFTESMEKGAESRTSALAEVEAYEKWRAEKAPHLEAWKGKETIDRYAKAYSSHRELVNEMSAIMGEEWIGEWKQTGYIPHYFKTQEKWEESEDPKKKNKTGREKTRIFDSYKEASEFGRLPDNLDIAELYKSYSTEMQAILSNRASASLMASTQDFDGLPMMLFSGATELGIISPETATGIAQTLKEAMMTIDSTLKLKPLLEGDGFAQLQNYVNQINPEALGYKVLQHNQSGVDTVWVKKGESEGIAKHIFTAPKQFNNVWAQKLFDATLSMNHLAKSVGIALSLFHPAALMESLIAIDGVSGHDGKGNMLIHPIKTWRSMKKTYRETLLNPDMNMEWIEAGLDFEVGSAPDYDYEELNEKMTEVSNNLIGSKVPFSSTMGYSIKAMTRVKKAGDTLLWEQMLPTMKIWSANALYAKNSARLVSEGKPVDQQQLREDISAYVNDAFGGQEWEAYSWANPSNRKWLQLTMFAPDWTISALNVSGLTHITPLNSLVKSPSSQLHAKERMETYWPAFASIILVALPNLVQAAIYGAFGDDDEDDHRWTFDNEIEHQLSIDITPIARAFGIKYGKTKHRRSYIHWGKQAHEVFDGWLGGPDKFVSTLMGKSSIASKIVFEQALGMQKPGWNMPWAKESFAKSLIDVDGNIWNGRIAGVVKKFIPMSIQPFFDERFSPGTGKPTTFFAPAKLGMSSYKAQIEIASVLRIYAEGGRKAEARGYKNYRFDIGSMVTEILDAAEKNGYDRKKVLGQGVSAARTYYYNEFFKGMSRNNVKKMDDSAERLIMLNTDIDQLENSLDRRNGTELRHTTPEEYISLGDAWRSGMKAAAKKGWGR